MRWLLSAFALGALVAAGAADAQTRDVLFSPILTIDQDRLFEQTRAGADRAQALEAAAADVGGLLTTDANRGFQQDLGTRLVYRTVIDQDLACSDQGLGLLSAARQLQGDQPEIESLPLSSAGQ